MIDKKGDNMNKWPGAKWWKFDFHTHTPASTDFRGQDVTPKDWLRRFMQAKIDCVAITDSQQWRMDRPT